MTIDSARAAGLQTDNDVLEIADYHDGGSGFVARRSVEVGGVVATLAGTYAPEPTRYTIQVSQTGHVDADEVRLLNHSCVPSTFVDTARARIVALRPVRTGDPLTFFYPSTEWRMATPFTCACGGDLCIGDVDGAENLPAPLLARYALNEHIVDLVAQRDGTTPARDR